MPRIPASVLRAARTNRREYMALDAAARAAVDAQWDRALANLADELADPASLSAFRASQAQFIRLGLLAARAESDAALRAVLEQALTEAAVMGAGHADDEIRSWLDYFGQEARPVDVRAAAHASLELAAETYAQSAVSWGQANVKAMRNAIAGGLLERRSHGQLVTQLTEALDTTRWRARRIVRTELSTAYHRAHMDTLRQARDDHGLAVRKTCLVTFDNRTAPDSRAMFGQVRDLDDLFTDGAGRQFLSPPGRPNDREKQIAYFGDS